MMENNTLDQNQKGIELENESSPARYKRFSGLHRLEHWIFITSFSVLGVTGLIQRFASSPISIAIIEMLGGIENVRIIHRISATIMMLIAVYHIGAIIYRLYVRRVRPTMLPGLPDFRAFYESVLYFIGRKKHQAQQGRFRYEEKVEYWAVVWGTVVMGFTGFMLWNPIATAKFLPGEVIPAAKAAHGLEAILAVLSIFVWHFYHVFIKHFNRSMYVGYLSEEEMLHEHPLELADIKAGIAQRTVDPEKKRKRQWIFWPTYSVLAAIMLAAIYFFVAYEETAIATVPQAEIVEVFVPLTPTPFPTPLPTSTPAPIEAVTWDAGIGDLFIENCGGCHNSASKLGGLDVTGYSSIMAGGNTGPAVIPESSDNSLAVVVQSQGDHPGQFTIEELELVIEWIQAGAPEK